MKPTMLSIDQIGYDPHYYPRVCAKEDWHWVNVIRDAILANPALLDLANPNHLDPIHVVPDKRKGWQYLIIDGLHRSKATRAAGYDKIPAIIERIPKSKWLARSAELNARGQRPLEPSDKAWVYERLSSDGYEPKTIAELLGMQVKSLEKIVSERVQRITVKEAELIPVGRGNRRINGKHRGFVKSPLKGLVGTAAGTNALRRQGPLNAKTAVNVLDSTIALLETGALDLKDEEIVARLATLKRLLRPLRTAHAQHR